VILNWLTIVVATAVYYGLAALSFADPLFAREWQRSVEWGNEAGERSDVGYSVAHLLHVSCPPSPSRKRRDRIRSSNETRPNE
jgi:hypothetical protein